MRFNEAVSTAAAAAATLVALVFLPLASDALSLYEPADGKFVLGFWPDIESGATSPSGGDTPSLINTRLGQKIGAFQLTQDIPLAISPFDQSQQTADVSYLQNTGTDAIFFITIYPLQGWDAVTDFNITQLATQLDNLSNPSGSARRVMVRLAPEFNGYWFPYGQKPTAFKTNWIKIVTAVRKQTKRVAFVWSPNLGSGYPYSQINSDAEITALDTNGDGQVTILDDPFTPYWPGADYVDWVGMSTYWKGDPNNIEANLANSAGYMETLLTNAGTNFNFYTMFPAKYNLPFVFSEAGAAFDVSYTGANGVVRTLAPGSGELAIKQAFWRSCITNTTFLNAYPKVKMYFQFEHIKVNEDRQRSTDGGFYRDYRISNSSSILNAFNSDLSSVSSRIATANPFIGGSDPLCIGVTSCTAGTTTGTTGTTTGGSGSPTATGTQSTGTVSTSKNNAGVSVVPSGTASVLAFMASLMCVGISLLMV